MTEAVSTGTAGNYTATTPVAKSSDAFDKIDVSEITWFNLSTLDVDNTKTFTVTVNLDASGNETVTVAQP